MIMMMIIINITTREQRVGTARVLHLVTFSFIEISCRCPSVVILVFLSLRPFHHKQNKTQPINIIVPVKY